MLLSRCCAGCRRPGCSLCTQCRRSLRPAAQRRRPGPLDELDHVIAVFDYDPVLADVVVQAKNGGRPDVLRTLGDALAEAVWHHANPGIDVVTWVPASRAGARRRGFDQGRVLARRAARGRPVNARRLLCRRGGGAQRGRGRRHRLAGPELGAVAPAPASVLVIDDVVTTGASLAAAARVLRAAGAERVVGATVALVDADSPSSLTQRSAPID